MFQKALQFKDVIIFYSNMQNIVRISDKVPPIFLWNIYPIIVDSLSPIVNARVVNSSNSQQVLSNVL
jgi:hypothetical protein